MKPILRLIYTEPAVFVGVAIAITSAAAGIWELQWLMFLNVAFAGLGAIFVRKNVAPVNS